MKQDIALETIYRACVEQTKAFMQSYNFTDVVIGLSGGLDSSVVAALCVDALGAEHVHGVLMPGPYSTDHSMTDAMDLAQRLGIEPQLVSICAPYEAFSQRFEQGCGVPLRGLASENTQARCRMIVLMALSNEFNWMVVNTGNLSEVCMGYCTLYGDMAGAFAPLGGLYKGQVFALAHWLNERAEAAGLVAPIPQHVLEKPPSAELSVGQLDEENMGIRYADLDAVLYMLEEQGLSTEEVVARGYDADMVAHIESRMRAYAFKRAMFPPHPDVSL